jgi:hypothetical protein
MESSKNKNSGPQRKAEAVATPEKRTKCDTSVGERTARIQIFERNLSR